MLRYVHADDLEDLPHLKETMFRDRAGQFAERLGWEVEVDDRGHERDAYDAEDPLYAIWERPDGSHGGSIRFLPTLGRTMVNDHFLHLMNGVPLRAPRIWECTRFCLSPGAEARVAAALMVACGEVFHGYALSQLVGVFDARMVRIYRMIGAPPRILGAQGAGRERIAVGLWTYEEADKDKVFARAGMTEVQSRDWFARSPAAARRDRSRKRVA
ncbi:acyl-homoserine-lactone synthase [Histidinibacterium lentulum]|uniref:Acyl-homoserine-lactone synthase n=1 Tax=Histidinibacterium lentulum TaxID=2480588 RepID=A0A3N2R0Y3_9RHOB|nr:acyl-homoserine-lactone synthase [Histidinibacterium lentulum]ROU01137.1 autoinducer synthase [Histidinibacterium lentulum]